MFAIIGIVLVVAAIVGGYLMEKGNLLVLLQPAELIIIAGAAAGTALIANPPYILKQIVGGIVAVFKVTPAPATAAGAPSALASATPNRTRASTETAPTAAMTIDAAACAPARIRVPGLAGLAAWRPVPAASAARASVAKAATSISPAAIPALVRTSLYPNNPVQTASR